MWRERMSLERCTSEFSFLLVCCLEYILAWKKRNMKKKKNVCFLHFYFA